MSARACAAPLSTMPAAVLGIKRSKGASDVVVAAAVQKRIDALKVAYPDVDLKLIDTSVEYTKGNYEAAISTLFEGAILAVVIVLMFLRDLSATIIAAISLTIIAIFAPASFMAGIAGQFFKQLGITVSVQVFFSLLAARFVTPMLAAYFMKRHDHEDPPPGRVLRGYIRLVTWSVRH